MHFMIFMRARAERDGRAFQDWYLKDHAPRQQERNRAITRHYVNLTTEGPPELRLAHDSADPRARYDVVAQIWCETVAEFRAATEDGAGAELSAWIDQRHAYRVSDTTILDKEPNRSDRSSGYTLLRELLFHGDMSDAAARRCWTHHAKLALKVHVGMTRYIQHWIDERMTAETPPARGISELYFPSREELAQRYYESPRGRDEIVHDTGHFIDKRLPRVYSYEHILRA